MGASLETKIAQAEKATAVLDSMDENGDIQVEKTPDGKIKIQLSEIVALDTFIPSTEMNAVIDEVKENTKAATEQKVETLSQGFMFQAGQPMAGDEPFFITVNLIGQDQYSVSSGKNGLLSREDIKALRKNLKAVMNAEKEQFNVGKKKNQEPTDEYDGGMDESYDYEGPDY